MITNKTFTGDNVPKTTKWLYCSSGMFRDMLYQFVSMFLLMFAQYCGIGKSEDYVAMYSTITVIIIVLRIWDGFNDPIMGYLIEKCKFRKFGKYRPWIGLGAILSSIITILMFCLPIHGWTYVICFGVFYFLWDMTYTINDIAFWSVLPSLSNKEKVRANLTTVLSIFVSIGSFTAGGLVPILSGQLGYTNSYSMFAIIASVLYCASQLILVIFMKEKKEEENEVKDSENMKFKEIFTVLIKNDQVRSSIISILLYYTGASILVTLGLNYFYFNFGYTAAGQYQLLFTVVFAVATLLGQGLYPLFTNKFKISRMKLFKACSIGAIGGYIILFCLVFPNEPIKLYPVMCALGFVIFFCQTIISLVLYINIQDSIEYNEYKFNERRESAVFSLRAFTAKLGSSIQQLVLYATLIGGSLLSISNEISGIESEAISKYGDDAIKVGEYIGPKADTILESVEYWQRIVFQVGFAIVPMLLILACYFVTTRTYKINEHNHAIMVQKLNERKNNE